MMCVKSYLDKSKVHGLGVYAGENIKKGTLIWRFNPAIDKALTQSEFESLPDFNRNYVLHYSYKVGDEYVLGGDYGIFFNHSDDPNTYGEDTEDGYGKTIAKRDIAKGEELTADYSDFEDDYKEKVGKSLMGNE